MGDFALASPTTTDEVRGALCSAREQGFAVHAHGRTPQTSAAGYGPRDAIFSMEHMDEIIAYEPGDLTITAEAGTSLNALSATVSQYDQRLSFEVPSGGTEATLGGVIATANEGFLGSALGPIREQILGMTVALSTGEIARVGGGVVKNVTGYDLTRVLCGSLGGLGIISEVTLRTHPIQEQTRTLILHLENASDCWVAAHWMRDAPCTVSGLAMACGSAVHSDDASVLLAVRLEGRMAILESAAVWITERAADATSISFEEQTLLWQGLTDFPKEQAFAARLFGRVSGLVNIAEKARSIEGTASITDLCGGSMVLTGPWDDPDEGMRAFDLLRLHRDHGLPIEIESDPHEARRRFDRFRPGSIERDLLLRVKTAFDPEHIMRRGHWLTDEGAQ